MNDNNDATKKYCSLQNQTQIDSKSIKSMVKMYYEDIMTEEEFDSKFKNLLYYSNRFTIEERIFIEKSISTLKTNGWWRAFSYKEHDCLVKIDSSGKWIIFVELKENENIPIYYNYDDYYGSYSRNFAIDNFPLALWNYGDKIGLDDFIGVQFFNEESWRRYFKRYTDFITVNMYNRERQKPMRVIGINSMVKLCMYLCDCLIKYNNNTIESAIRNNFNECMGYANSIQSIATKYRNLKDWESLSNLNMLLSKIINGGGSNG